MVTFCIVRHGQTLLNQLDRAQGWADFSFDCIRRTEESGQPTMDKHSKHDK